jgi:hypothetical protein
VALQATRKLKERNDFVAREICKINEASHSADA